MESMTIQTETIITKFCTRCEDDLPVDSFVKNKGTKDGLGTYCRPCFAGYMREMRKNPEVKAKIKEYGGNRYAQLKEKIISQEEIDAYPTTKECTRCRIVLPLEGFADSPKGKYGKNAHCPDCRTESLMRWRVESRDKYRESRRKTRIKTLYGLSPEEVQKMVEDQEGLCCICETEPDELVIDHCHDSGEVRGLLCRQCNVVLGNAKDNVNILLGAIDYLLVSQRETF